MNPAEIRKVVQAQPFEPFRLHLSSGASFVVPHPDFIWITLSAVHIATETGRDDVPSKSVVCSPLHITHLEPVNGSVPDQQAS